MTIETFPDHRRVLSIQGEQTGLGLVIAHSGWTHIRGQPRPNVGTTRRSVLDSMATASGIGLESVMIRPRRYEHL